jgi:hypothetical protein
MRQVGSSRRGAAQLVPNAGEQAEGADALEQCVQEHTEQRQGEAQNEAMGSWEKSWMVGCMTCVQEHAEQNQDKAQD